MTRGVTAWRPVGAPHLAVEHLVLLLEEGRV